MTAGAQDGGFRIKGWHVLVGFIAFFGLVVAVDTGFVVMSIKTFPGQVSVTPYEDGLVYDRTIAQQAAQAKLGWRARAGAEPHGVSIEMRDSAGAPIRGLQVSGDLQRPATESGRRTVAFRETQPGIYMAPAAGLSGAWDLTATAVAKGGERFIAERRLTWP